MLTYLFLLFLCPLLATSLSQTSASLVFSSPTQLPWGCPTHKCRYGGSTAADSFVSFGGALQNTVIGVVHNSNTTSVVAHSADSGSTWTASSSGGLGPGISYLISNNTRTTIGNAVLYPNITKTAAYGSTRAIYNISAAGTLERTIVHQDSMWKFPLDPKHNLSPVCLFSSYSGKVIQIYTPWQGKTWLKTVVIKRNCTKPPAGSWGTLGYADIWIFASVDQTTWHYQSEVANHAQTKALGYEEGANENDIAVLADGTLLVVFRADGGDGYPHHSRKPFLQVTSTDNGVKWSLPVPMADNVGSARPMLLLTGSGVLLLSGGRPYLNLWASMDGLGKQWDSYNLAGEHNRAARTGTWNFCESFANGTSTWQGSTCYTSLVQVEKGSALVCYDNLGTASPVAPVECQTNPVLTFCMRIGV